jgi:hypothetical protein
MSVTQDRVDNYLAAEALILAQGQSSRFDVRERQQAELDTIRKTIAQLQRELATETNTAAGRGALRYKTVVFDR